MANPVQAAVSKAAAAMAAESRLQVEPEVRLNAKAAAQARQAQHVSNMMDGPRAFIGGPFAGRGIFGNKAIPPAGFVLKMPETKPSGPPLTPTIQEEQARQRNEHRRRCEMVAKAAMQASDYAARVRVHVVESLIQEAELMDDQMAECESESSVAKLRQPQQQSETVDGIRHDWKCNATCTYQGQGVCRGKCSGMKGHEHRVHICQACAETDSDEAETVDPGADC